MVQTAEVVLRQRFCVAAGCGALFWICRCCDRGQRYCSDRCRAKARREQRRAANLRHQQSPEGRADHRQHQRDYRKRQAKAAKVFVTDQSSPDSCPTGNITAPVSTSPVVAEDGDETSHQTRIYGPGVPYCIICGRPGRFVDPFQRGRGT